MRPDQDGKISRDERERMFADENDTRVSDNDNDHGNSVQSIARCMVQQDLQKLPQPSGIETAWPVVS